MGEYHGYFIISFGLGGSFGIEYLVVKATDINEAQSLAYDYACIEYDNVAGTSGIRDHQDIMDEDDVDQEEAEQIYNEDRESWIEYSVYYYNKITEKKFSIHSYDNPYKDILGEILGDDE